MVSVYWLFHAALAVVVAALLVVSVGATPASATDGTAYKLGPGDKVRVTVFNEKDLSGDFDVNDQGQIALPLIGAVKVAGRTISGVENLITQRYGKDYLVDPHVNVEVLNYRPFFILGEVKNPGSYPYQNGMTVVNAVALAGGYTPRADKGGIYIEHGNDQKGQEHQAKEGTPVLPGDVIHVPERFF
jgi:protein involved in polysaccharide export with SLBB domain